MEGHDLFSLEVEVVLAYESEVVFADTLGFGTACAHVTNKNIIISPLHHPL